MKLAVSVFVAAVIAVCSCKENHSPPRVQLYSSGPGQYGVKNVLICHAADFYPPNLKITIMKNEVEIDVFNQTDLTFKGNWHFHLTKSVDFTPERGEMYTCKVEHAGKDNTYKWESNM